MDFGRIGVWTWLDGLPADEAVDFVRKLADWGYSDALAPGGRGPRPVRADRLARGAHRAHRLRTGIANIYARDPMTMRAIQQTLAELAPGRVRRSGSASPTPTS